MNNAENNGRIFNNGYAKGKEWQKEKDKYIIEKLISALRENNVQLEYLNEKFQETGTSNTVIARNNELLNQIQQS